MSVKTFSREALRSAQKWLVDNDVIGPQMWPGYVLAWNLYLVATGRKPKATCSHADAMRGLRAEFFGGLPKEPSPDGIDELKRIIAAGEYSFLEKKDDRKEQKKCTNPKPIKSPAKFRPQSKSRESPAVSRKFLASPEWRRLRYDALKLHGSRCQCCGASPNTGAVINVDHILPRSTHPHLALDINNLQILCATCNAGKGNRDTTDWRDLRVAPTAFKN